MSEGAEKTVSLPNCPHCGGDRCSVEQYYSVVEERTHRVLECPQCGCVHPLPLHASEDAAVLVEQAAADSKQSALVADPKAECDRDALFRLASDMEHRTELDHEVGSVTVRRWARRIRAALGEGEKPALAVLDALQG